VRCLLAKGKGLPCADPRPHPLIGESGVDVGDVGIFTCEDGFQKLFNLWDKQVYNSVETSLYPEFSVQPKQGLVPVPPLSARACRHREDKLEEGEIIMTGTGATFAP